VVNYIKDVNESFFIKSKNILDKYKNIFDIKIAGSIVRNKPTKVFDFDISVLLNDNLDNLHNIKYDILKLQNKYYPKFDVMFFKDEHYNNTLLYLEKNNFSSYRELIKYPFISIKDNNKCYNFEYGQKFQEYSKTPFTIFMSKIELSGLIEQNKLL